MSRNAEKCREMSSFENFPDEKIQDRITRFQWNFQGMISIWLLWLLHQNCIKIASKLHQNYIRTTYIKTTKFINKYFLFCPHSCGLRTLCITTIICQCQICRLSMSVHVLLSALPLHCRGIITVRSVSLPFVLLFEPPLAEWSYEFRPVSLSVSPLPTFLRIGSKDFSDFFLHEVREGSKVTASRKK